jgi:hypothetical protein
MERDAEAKAERAELERRLEAQRRETEAQRRETEAKVEAQRRETEAQRRETEAQRQQLEAERHKLREVSFVQLRLEALHNAKLLTDEEMFALEDMIADSFEDPDHEDEEGGGSRTVACEKVSSLVTLSGCIASNPAFARQVRRKYVK